jgi:hypothetical protein
MRFTIEQRHLTDTTGKPVRDLNAVEYHAFDAESVQDAIRLFIRKEQAEIIGDVLTFPGFQAVATVRSTNGVYTLQVSPASGKYVVC